MTLCRGGNRKMGANSHGRKHKKNRPIPSVVSPPKPGIDRFPPSFVLSQEDKDSAVPMAASLMEESQLISS